MLDVIAGSLAILQRAERLIVNAHWLIASGLLEEGESLELRSEIETMTAVVLALEQAVWRLQHRFGTWPDMTQVLAVHPTVQ